MIEPAEPSIPLLPAGSVVGRPVSVVIGDRGPEQVIPLATTAADEDDWKAGFRLYDDVADALSEVDDDGEEWPSSAASQALTEELSARRQERPTDDPL